MLLDEFQIQAGLDAEFARHGSEFSAMRLTMPGPDRRRLVSIATSLGETLPESFLSLATRYNFGSLALGPIIFGQAGAYPEQLLEYNDDPVSRWWSTEHRPSGYLMIANSEEWAFLLECATGAILAFAGRIESSPKVARDFLAFFRGVGSVIVLRLQGKLRGDAGDKIAACVGSDGGGNSIWRRFSS